MTEWLILQLGVKLQNTWTQDLEMLPVVLYTRKHHDNPDLPRFAGYGGHNKERRRFKMEPTFDPVHKCRLAN
jgi:hypothetical protein